MTEPDVILSSASTGTLSTWTGTDPAERTEGSPEPETDIGHVLHAGTGAVSTWTGQDPADREPAAEAPTPPSPQLPDAPPAQEPEPSE